MKPIKVVALGLVGMVSAAAADGPKAAPAGTSWLPAEDAQKFETLAKHLRGNDVAMWEVEHRFERLGQAGFSGNWEYAKYQLEMMERAMRLAYERRPARQASYDVFFKDALPPMKAAIKAKDAALFETQVKVMGAQCLTCHVSEKLAFIPVTLPVKPESR